MSASKLPANVLKRTIAYIYLAAYCPPEKLGSLARAGAPLRRRLAHQVGMGESEFFRAALPEVCSHIAAYHEHSRAGDPQRSAALLKMLVSIGRSDADARAFQSEIAAVAALPGRAKLENRLHRRKGCAYCTAPCQYGYFSLVSEPALTALRRILEKEAAKPTPDQDAVVSIMAFTRFHLWRTLGVKQDFITPRCLGNLGYCLLMLGIARSRYPFPAEKVQRYQELSQATIQRMEAGR
jgi:hypothetical protein